VTRCLPTTSFGAGSIRCVWRTPYGRYSERSRWNLVLTEGCGTCSTKHALLAVLAREQDLDVDLILAMFEMDAANRPGVGAVLEKHGLRSVPEAHCFLRRQGIPAQQPSGRAQTLHSRGDNLDQIGDYKVMMHLAFVARWLTQLGRNDLDIEQLWQIRELASRRSPPLAQGFGAGRKISDAGRSTSTTLLNSTRKPSSVVATSRLLSRVMAHDPGADHDQFLLTAFGPVSTDYDSASLIIGPERTRLRWAPTDASDPKPS
jgi:hypothetical protein